MTHTFFIAFDHPEIGRIIDPVQIRTMGTARSRLAVIQQFGQPEAYIISTDELSDDCREELLQSVTETIE